jgi:RNA polymerase sigma-70 factor (ECF subfamily)
MASDAELLAKWREGDNDAGNELVERHFMTVYRFFVNKVSHDADDLIQRTFLACVEARDRVREGQNLRSYILGIARNTLFATLRKRRRGEMPIGDMTMADLEGSPSRIAAGREEEKILLEALRQIPVGLQTVIELYYWEQMSVGEIAEILEVPAGTVKSRLFRARDNLRERIESMDVPAKLLQTTVNGLENWAAALRERLNDRDSIT